MEVTSKRRNWIKNAVIIFLVILLVLTFFSNTFMNRSLPEVATQYVTAQTITTAVRGTGTVSANSDYEVEFDGDRTIKSVAVKPGSTVAAGDVLFELYEEEEDGALQALKEELADLEYNYRLALLNMTDSDYARENREIADAKKDLQELIAKRDASLVTAGDMTVAENNVSAAEKAVEDAQEKVDKLNEQLTEAGDGGGDGSALKELYQQYSDAVKELETVKITYRLELTIFDEALNLWKNSYPADTNGVRDMSVLRAAFAELLNKEGYNNAKTSLSNLVNSDVLRDIIIADIKSDIRLSIESEYTLSKTEIDIKRSNIEADYTSQLEDELREKNPDASKVTIQQLVAVEWEKRGIDSLVEADLNEYIASQHSQAIKNDRLNIDRRVEEEFKNVDVDAIIREKKNLIITGHDYSDYYTAYTKLKSAQDKYDDLSYQLASYFGSITPSTSTVSVDKLTADLKASKEELKTAQKALETANKILTDLQTKQSSYDTLCENVKTAERSLEDLIFNLSEQKKDDNNAIAKDQLALNRQKEDIEKKKAEIDRFSGGESVGVITSPVDGTVKQINISAGKKTSSVVGALCVIEESGRGYTLSIPISAEQSRKLTIGDTGSVDNGWWWGSSVTATLTAMIPDPANPQNQKIAYFSLEGDDINAGDQLTISINQRSVSYDMVVPTSAVRDDSNGKYVLILQAKNTPLGDRYYARRADVQVLASDDTNSAITGGVAAYDYVITSASAPIEPGDMVRLSDK